MKRPAVRCRCGHQVLAKEVLRTDLYERPSGREYVYVKYRCKRCKRMGETFVAEHCWDWRIFEAARHELSDLETQTFSDQPPISSEELLDFHIRLDTIFTTGELAQSGNLSQQEVASADNDKPRGEGDNQSALPGLGETISGSAIPKDAKTEAPSKTPRGESKRADGDVKKDSKKDPEKTRHPEDGGAR